MIRTLTRLIPTSHRTQKVHCIPVAHWMRGYWRQITVVQRSAVESFQWRQPRRLRVPIARSLIQWSTLCPCTGEPGRIRVRVLRTVALLRVVCWVWIQEGCSSSVSRCICYLKKNSVIFLIGYWIKRSPACVGFCSSLCVVTELSVRTHMSAHRGSYCDEFHYDTDKDNY